MERTSITDAGFTLLEVLFAMAILGVGVLSIGLAQLSAVKISSRSEHLSQAMYLAQEQMEVFMALPQGAAFLQAPLVDAPDPNNPIDVEATDDDYTNFTRTWTIEPGWLPPPPNPLPPGWTPPTGLTRITITVFWNTAHSGLSNAAVNEAPSVQLQGVRPS